MAEASQLKEILSQSSMGGRNDSGANVRQPRIKKNSEKQKEMKTRLSHWLTKRPASGTVGQKPMHRRTLSDQDLCTHKRMLIQNQQSRWSNYYGSTLGAHSKIPAESRCYSTPSKPATRQNPGKEKAYNPVTRDEDKNVAKRGHHSQPLEAERYSGFNRFVKTKRLTPEELEKKRYETIAEYQFMTPGKTFYYCTRENVKQHLRSIYLARQPGQKPPKSVCQTNWPPVFSQDRQRRLRKNPFAGAPCLAPGKFLGNGSSLCTPSMPHGMMELAHKISKLALVSERRPVPQGNSPKRTAVNGSHMQQQQQLPPTTEKLIPAANELQVSSAMEGKEGQTLEQGFSVKTVPRGSGIKTLQALEAVQGIINNGRGASHTICTLKKKPGAGSGQALMNTARLNFSKDSADRKDVALDLQNLPQSRNSQDSKDSAIIIPMLDRLLTPEESTDMELLPNVHSSSAELAVSPAVGKDQAFHPSAVRPSDLSFASQWEKTSSVPKHCISMEKGHKSFICSSETLQGLWDPENEKEVGGCIDNLSVPFQRKGLGTEVLFSLSDEDDD